MKIGDYVRTKDGLIAKIIGKRVNPYGKETIFKLDKEIKICDLKLSDEYFMLNPLAEETTNEIDTHFGDEKIIIKSSPSIIDLIEVGDYVNGYQVIEKPYMYHDIQFVSVDTQDSWSWGKGEMPVENIKSIVTKEMYSSVEYRVESH